ncbi:MAG: thiamine pyrophosphate-dependent enzyme [Candidatus Hydrogenedentes bacterium]|nr:thiamine pyrophosphate-dependent enzyme [Candidatus Hydrogenedentota bacterium]
MPGKKNKRPKPQDAGVESISQRNAARMLFDISLIHTFELALLELKQADCIWGPVHSSIGQEATAVATIHALEKSDMMTGTHRAHHQFLGKVINYTLPDDWSPLESSLSTEAEEVVQRSMAEIMGLAPGYCGGRGGSMHLRHKEAGFLGSNAIVAGGIPLSTGVAFAEKFRKTGNVIVACFGDGAVNQGAFHEAANFAGAWDLPIIFFIENNYYAVATHTDDVCAVSDLSSRATAYGMEGYSVDGSDTMAIYATVQHAASKMRTGGSPCFIEARCYRRFHHAQNQPGSAFKYRSKDEEADWLSKEPITRFPQRLMEAGILDETDVVRIRELAQEAVDKAVAFCTLPGDPPTLRSELWPNPETVGVGIRSEGAEWKGIEFHERQDFDCYTEMMYSDAIAATSGRWLERDAETFILGEEVANFGGGAYGATKNLPAQYPKRVFNTPISEAGIVGLALGAAMSGMRPIAEIMFPDFALVAADQLFNQVAKARHMYGNTTDLPLVVRTRIATGCGYGGQHSMDPVGLYGLFPGWRIIAPSNAFDYIGLFNSAMHSLDPVIILEHHTLYTQKFPVPKGDLDYFVPFGKARLVQEGTDVTVITYGSMVGRCEQLQEAWKSLGVSAEIIDLRTLDALGIDYDLIGESLKKSGAGIIVEEAATSLGIGSRIASESTERFFDYLDSPIARLSSADVPNSVSKVLEAAAMLQDETITEITVAVAQRRWK